MDFSSSQFNSGFTGGYSPSQPSSQPVQASMTPSPKKTSTDKPESHGVLPVTVKAYREHMESCEKDTIMIYDLPAAKVVIVGVVKSCDVKPTNHSVLIDDQSGLIYAQNFQHNRKEVSAGDVVRVVATPRPAAGDDAIVSVINLTVIPEDEAAEAIGFHLIHSCLAQCQTSARGVPMDDLTPAKAEAQTARPGAAATQSPVKSGGADLAGAALQTAIKDCIRGFPQTEEGFAITRIADALAKSAKPALVKATIDEMVEDGSLFTIDEGFVLCSED
jgi:hypothetical protein